MESLKAIVLLGLDGKRVLAKYFDDKINSKQFDRKLYSRTKAKKIRENIFTVDGLVIIHRCVNDLHMYIAGSRAENPLVLDQILNCLTEVVSTLLSRSEKHSISENIDQLIIALDEICDSGIPLEIDPSTVVDRVSLKADFSTKYSFPWVN